MLMAEELAVKCARPTGGQAPLGRGRGGTGRGPRFNRSGNTV